MHKVAILSLPKALIQRRRFMSDLVVYGAPLSPFVRKVLAALHEKDLDYELEAVNTLQTCAKMLKRILPGKVDLSPAA